MWIDRLGDKLEQLARGKEKDFNGEILTEIQEPIPLEELLNGPPCGGCQNPMEKAYIRWSFPSDINEHRLKVAVDNTPGYKCACGCNFETPSHLGLVQAIDQAIPAFKDKGFRHSVANLEWTKQQVLEVILPLQEELHEIIREANEGSSVS
jgi:hypothetical protein